MLLALAIVIALCCGWCATGIDAPPIDTPTPRGIGGTLIPG